MERKKIIVHTATQRGTERESSQRHGESQIVWHCATHCNEREREAGRTKTRQEKIIEHTVTHCKKSEGKKELTKKELEKNDI